MSSRRLWRVPASLAVCGGLAVAQSLQPAPPVAAPIFDQPASWLEAIFSVSLFHWFSLNEPAPPVPVTPETALAAIAVQPPPCGVAPLTAVTDLDAMEFETGVGSDRVVNRHGLTPATSRALTRFEGLVSSVGGAMTLTSAFRPAAYQEHLQDVWDKWMVELRYNTDPACAALSAQVADEFSRHQLLPTQRPVPISDHTLGIGFDAAVQLPLGARMVRRTRVTLDRLARLSGVLRPDIRRDPVHFRLIGGRS